LNQNLRKKLHQLLENKGYKSFGDVLLNFLYSYHRYLKFKEIKGYKLKNKDLAELYDKFLSSYFSRVDVHKKGDIIEALVAYCFINGYLSFKDLDKLLKTDNFLEKLIKTCLEKLINE